MARVGLRVFPSTHVHLEPQNVTLFGNGDFADVIRVRLELRSSWARVGPEPEDSHGALLEGDTHGGEATWTQRQRLRAAGATSQRALEPPGQEEHPPRGRQGEPGPARSWILDVWPQTEREQVTAAFSDQFVGLAVAGSAELCSPENGEDAGAGLTAP